MPSADVVSVIIRIALLFVLTLGSDIALRTRHYSLSIFIFTLWITYFRLGLFRVVEAGLGLFGKETATVNNSISAFLFSSNTSNVTDILVLIGVIILVKWCIREYRWRNGAEEDEQLKKGR